MVSLQKLRWVSLKDKRLAKTFAIQAKKSAKAYTEAKKRK